jgi:hypothetical protein
MSTVAEGVGYQMPIHGQQQPYVMGGMPLAMEIDGMNLWWDHTFEGIETDRFGVLLGGYPWGAEERFIPPR